MFNKRWILILMALALLAGACRSSGKPTTDAKASGSKTSASKGAVPFEAASLIVEVNATDGDAGFQIFLDHEPWRSVSLFRPDGMKIMEVTNQGVLRDFGLTELFSESSEPPFTKFPLDEFKKLFPPGQYRLIGTTIDGGSLESMVTLTHDFPAGPEILLPKKDAKVPAGDLTVSWDPVTKPSGIEIIGYQVLVEREDPLRTFSADLPANATKIRVPSEFLETGASYKVEVLAIEKNHNQTLSEVAFKTA